MPDLNLTAFAADSFDAATLTTRINAAPYAPGVIARRKVFREVPMSTTEAPRAVVLTVTDTRKPTAPRWH